MRVTGVFGQQLPCLFLWSDSPTQRPGAFPIAKIITSLCRGRLSDTDRAGDLSVEQQRLGPASARSATRKQEARPKAQLCSQHKIGKHEQYNISTPSMMNCTLDKSQMLLMQGMGYTEDDSAGQTNIFAVEVSCDIMSLKLVQYRGSMAFILPWFCKP